jgi:hypothetical protein
MPRTADNTGGSLYERRTPVNGELRFTIKMTNISSTVLWK